MKWQGRPQSDNVQIAATEDHPEFGGVETFRDFKTGELELIHPTGLYEMCEYALTDHFQAAHDGAEQYPRVLDPIQMEIEAAYDCHDRVSSFFNEFSEGRGFEIVREGALISARRIAEQTPEVSAEPAVTSAPQPAMRDDMAF